MPILWWELSGTQGSICSRHRHGSSFDGDSIDLDSFCLATWDSMAWQLSTWSFTPYRMICSGNAVVGSILAGWCAQTSWAATGATRKLTTAAFELLTQLLSGKLIDRLGHDSRWRMVCWEGIEWPLQWKHRRRCRLLTVEQGR